VAGARNKAAFAGESEKARIEADEIAIVFGDGGGQIVKPDLAACSGEELKSVNMAAGKGLESLAVRELQIHFAAVGFDQAEGVKLARGAVVNERAEVAPVHIESFAGRRFDANVSAAGYRVLSESAQVILDDGEAAVVSQQFQPLSDHGSVGVRVLLEQFADDRLEWIELAGAIAMSGLRSRGVQILRNGAAADPHMPRDFAQGPFLHKVEAVEFADLIRREHP
jgi:hypothetical protein